MACWKDETFSLIIWVISQKICVVLDGCGSWHYCFNANNIAGWIIARQSSCISSTWGLRLKSIKYDVFVVHNGFGFRAQRFKYKCLQIVCSDLVEYLGRKKQKRGIWRIKSSGDFLALSGIKEQRNNEYYIMTELHSLHWLRNIAVVIKATEMKEKGRVIIHIR